MDEAPGPRASLASLADVARAADVSIATVSRVVNGQTNRAGRETVARVMQAVERLGYRPNHAGRSLRRRESQIVAMLAPNLDNPAMAAIAASTEAALREAGYVMILCDTHDRAELQDEYLEAMRAQMARAAVLVSAVASPGLAGAMKRGDALVFVNRRNPMGPGAFVGVDNLRIGADAADFLHAQGARDAATLAPSAPSSTIAERVEGFSARWRVLGGARPRAARGAGPDHLAIGGAAVDRLVARGGWPAGLFCPSDLIAYAAYRRALADGVTIPDDCRLVGVDGNALNRWIAPWLASVAVPYPAFGAAVVEQLEARWAGRPPGQRILPHRAPALAD
ncbi:MAG: LacI family DNA-binding transcriptional regulator [Rhizobiales bacterium]|nr:LacI family DNA-binding transcriptional regulator [Hyphomicrobiales bacterium]